MIHYIEYGDIFNIPGVTCYAHGCNCAGAMGKGIALQFKAKFREMYFEYKRLCDNGEFNPEMSMPIIMAQGMCLTSGLKPHGELRLNSNILRMR